MPTAACPGCSSDGLEGLERCGVCTPAITVGTLPDKFWATADVAQLVEHHLAKVRVAGSSPVVRSKVPGHETGRESHGPARALF